MPKSSVSRGIARLEDELGTQLLHRTTRTVGLTAAGTALYGRVAPLLASLKEAVGSLPERAESPSGVLRITAPNDLGATLLPEVIARFVLRFPRVRIETLLTNRYVDLVAEGVDIGLRASARPLEDSTLVVRKLSEVEVHAFASPTYLARRGTPRSVDDLAGHELVVFRGRTGASLPVAAESARISGDDFFFIREALRAGAGIGVLPTFLAQEDVAAGLLVRVLPKFSESSARLFLVYPGARHVPAKVTAFRDFLLEYLALRPLAPRVG